MADDSDGWECAHCGETKDESEFDDDSLVCRGCEARQRIRGMTIAADDAVRPEPDPVALGLLENIGRGLALVSTETFSLRGAPSSALPSL
jgi:hypothetical protein